MNSLSFMLDKNMNTYAAFRYADRIDKYDREGNLILRIKTSPLRSGIKNYGIAIDSKERIWLITRQKFGNPKDEVTTTLLVNTETGISYDRKGNLAAVKTDEFALELYDKGGSLLFRFPLTHFMGLREVIKINGNKIYIMEDTREGTFHVYKISDL